MHIGNGRIWINHSKCSKKCISVLCGQQSHFTQPLFCSMVLTHAFIKGVCMFRAPDERCVGKDMFTL